MEDFYRPKLMYSEIVKSPQFYLDNSGCFFPEATTFIITGEKLKFLYNIFHSSVVTFLFKRFYAGGGLGEEGYRYKKAFFERLPIPHNFDNVAFSIIEKATAEMNIDSECASLYNLTNAEMIFIESQQSQ